MKSEHKNQQEQINEQSREQGNLPVENKQIFKDLCKYMVSHKSKEGMKRIWFLFSILVGGVGFLLSFFIVGHQMSISAILLWIKQFFGG